jgi:hypothetical protein
MVTSWWLSAKLRMVDRSHVAWSGGPRNILVLFWRLPFREFLNSSDMPRPLVGVRALRRQASASDKELSRRKRGPQMDGAA